MKTNDERLNLLLDYIDNLSHIKPGEIPNIDLYMDQVTTFMDEHLSQSKRYEEDKILTKTMINNYAKNNLLPPPEKKKYTREHILLLVFIYYFKNVLSFHDIEQLFRPITANHFSAGADVPLAEVYEEIFSLEKEQRDRLKNDVLSKFDTASKAFGDKDLDEEDREFLRLFAFLCELSFDVYLKKQMIELTIDQLREEYPPKKKK